MHSNTALSTTRNSLSFSREIINLCNGVLESSSLLRSRRDADAFPVVFPAKVRKPLNESENLSRLSRNKLIALPPSGGGVQKKKIISRRFLRCRVQKHWRTRKVQTIWNFPIVSQRSRYWTCENGFSRVLHKFWLPRRWNFHAHARAVIFRPADRYINTRGVREIWVSRALDGRPRRLMDVKMSP